ncbi:MAG TPA: M48 family metallopeptidase [Phycisphaerales bacterium]|nr:M48 family metallopeptidase [Phycisphaerales bacterium]
MALARSYRGQRIGQRSGPRVSPRLLIGAVIAIIALVTYFSRTQVNPVTGEKQRIAASFEQEVAMGLQAAPQMAQEFGGLHPDAAAQALVDRVGGAIVAALPEEAPPYPYEFHLLADPRTVNAFALPGGQIFITAALYERLETEGQLAGVLGHEVGHVVGRHSAERLAKAQLTQGLVGAVAVGSSDTAAGQQMAANAAAMVGNMVMLKYGREDELQSDQLGLRFMADAGYDPRAMVRVMQILEQASGGSRVPEFSSSHPNPGNRIERINALIEEMYPGGVPEGLKK